jgi:phytoene dehydrogenase-like protein
MPPTAIVIGAGHNGLVAACYLAREGIDVTVFEQSDKPGGGSRTDETVPGYRFDTHSVAHNLINMTDIGDELELAAAGLDYVEMDPFAVSISPEGETIRFWRDVDKTVESIRAVVPDQAEPYRRFIEDAWPIMELAVTGINAGASWQRELQMLPHRIGPLAQALRRHGGVFGLAELLAMPYGPMLRRYLSSDAVLAPIGAFAAHGSASPNDFGTAFSAIWQAVYHRHGQWHARGGSQALTDALVTRLRSLGGTVECDAPVAQIVQRDGQVRGVRLEDGQQVVAPVVVSAIDPRVALLDRSPWGRSGGRPPWQRRADVGARRHRPPAPVSRCGAGRLRRPAKLRGTLFGIGRGVFRGAGPPVARGSGPDLRVHAQRP